jgi:hypothetical protein
VSIPRGFFTDDRKKKAIPFTSLFSHFILPAAQFPFIHDYLQMACQKTQITQRDKHLTANALPTQLINTLNRFKHVWKQDPSRPQPQPCAQRKTAFGGKRHLARQQ